MDTLLEGGGFVLNAGGLPKTVRGTPALLQRAALRLQARQGAFVYDGALGSGLAAGSAGAGAALDMARGALLPLPEVRPLGVRPAEGGRLTVTVLVRGETHEIEVITDADL